MILYLYVYDVTAYGYVGTCRSMRLLEANCSTSKSCCPKLISSNSNAYHCNCLSLTYQCAERVLSFCDMLSPAE